MKKKMFALSLAAAMTLTLLAGCGGKETTSTPAPDAAGEP